MREQPTQSNKEREDRRFKHGKSYVHEYRVWLGIMARCTNPGHHAYHNYGGRGIRVCGWWQTLDSFLADIGTRPSPKHSIDRTDNDGHYSCGHCEECKANGWKANCRWAERIAQGSNKRNNRLITLGSETKTLSEWARVRGIKLSTIWRRLKRGSTPDKALAIEDGRRNRLSQGNSNHGNSKPFHLDHARE